MPIDPSNPKGQTRELDGKYLFQKRGRTGVRKGKGRYNENGNVVESFLVVRGNSQTTWRASGNNAEKVNKSVLEASGPTKWNAPCSDACFGLGLAEEVVVLLSQCLQFRPKLCYFLFQLFRVQLTALP